MPAPKKKTQSTKSKKRAGPARGRKPRAPAVPFKLDRKCGDCPALCCRYIAIELDTPRTPEEFDNLRWYLAHANVSVYVQDKKWHLCVESPCRYISRDGYRCTIHDSKPSLCREHDPAGCEFNNPEFRLELELKSCEDLAEYMKKKGLTRFAP